MNKNRVCAAQCRAGRALIGWSQAKLAGAAKISRGTVAEFEQGQRELSLTLLREIERAFTRAGVVPIYKGETEGRGSGVCFVSSDEVDLSNVIERPVDPRRLLAAQSLRQGIRKERKLRRWLPQR